ncbi:MAG: hypothetical protein EBS05_25385 [Proteobacteria bacterium]|nr:hypothetical protein [Pseudomonadota bacterium]
MSPDISEFSYGFALVDELIHWHGWPLRGVPVYPSLRREARVGYDVHLLRSNGIPVFLQFKLADRMERRSAKEVRAGHFTPPFYRMHLRPSSHSRQHQLLLALEAAGQEVFYVAPTFALPSQLNDAYLHHQVRQRSCFFRPSAIGPLPTPGHHHVAFTGPGNFLLCSQPQSKSGAMDGKGFEEEMSAKVREKGRDALAPASLDRLCAGMMDALPEILDESGTHKGQAFATLSDRLDALGRVAYLARTFYGCTMLVVRRKRNRSPRRTQ